MKKTLIAMAALAATGAFAQVTVYGRLDAGYANTTTSTTAAGVSTDTKANGVMSHNSVSSMWGMKGTEDLGGGMNAFFVLEQDIFPANGNTGVTGAAGGGTNAAGFNRTSLVGLNGGFGSIAFGRDYNAVFKLIAATDVMSLSRLSTVQNAANIGGSTIANLISYSTPDMSGFKVNLNYGNDDTSSGAVDAKVKTTALTGTYANGPLFVGIGAGNVESTQGAGVVSKTEGTALGASYNFGMVKVIGNYITKKVTAAASDAETKETNIGVSAPMGKVTLLAQVGRNTNTQSLGGTTDTSGTDMVIGADYALSARTALYVKTGTYNKSSGTLLGDATADTKATSTAFGLKTSF